MALSIERESVVTGLVALALTLTTLLFRPSQVFANDPYGPCRDQGFDMGLDCWLDFSENPNQCAQCLGGECGLFAGAHQGSIPLGGCYSACYASGVGFCVS